MVVNTVLFGQVAQFCSIGAMDDLPFPLVRSLPFSRCAKERDSWELRQICGHSLTCEQNKIVCVVTSLCLVFSYCPYLFCRADSQVGRYQGKCILGANETLPEHCQRGKLGSRLVRRKGTLLSWQDRRVNDAAGGCQLQQRSMQEPHGQAVRH